MSAAADDTGLVRIDRVSKHYESEAGQVKALREVSLTIERGEFVAIVGTSGSGKSTLMNILGCLDRPTHGTYHLAGLDVGQRTNDGRALVRNRLIGFIFQGFNLLPRTTALENVELPLQYRGVPAAERRRRAMRSLTQVGLSTRVHHTPNQLSGGQQQRVAIARALVTDPPLLLADEPTGNLDSRTSYEVLALLQDLNRTAGITIVLVTHEHDIAACASRVIVVKDGLIESDTRNASPVDAASELAALPLPPDAPAAGATQGAATDTARRRLGGPVPVSIYLMAALGFVLGQVVGGIYTRFVLAETTPAVPLLFGLLGEAWLGTRYARKRLSAPLTPDQRGRVAVWYSVAFTAVAALIVGVFVLPKVPSAMLGGHEGMTSRRVAGALAGVLGWVAASTALRYVLWTLFGGWQRASRRAALPAGAQPS